MKKSFLKFNRFTPATNIKTNMLHMIKDQGFSKEFLIFEELSR